MVEILRARRKAIVALVVSLAGGLLAVFPDSAGMQILAAVVTALATTFGVHQVANDLPAVNVGIDGLGGVIGGVIGGGDPGTNADE